MNKTHSERIHAKRRAKERFGLELNRHQLRELVKQIQSGKAEHLETQSNRVSIKRVKFEGSFYTVAYDKNRQTIITFLPEEERNNE